MKFHDDPDRIPEPAELHKIADYLEPYRQCWANDNWVVLDLSKCLPLFYAIRFTWEAGSSITEVSSAIRRISPFYRSLEATDFLEFLRAEKEIVVGAYQSEEDAKAALREASYPAEIIRQPEYNFLRMPRRVGAQINEADLRNLVVRKMLAAGREVRIAPGYGAVAYKEKLD